MTDCGVPHNRLWGSNGQGEGALCGGPPAAFEDLEALIEGFMAEHKSGREASRRSPCALRPGYYFFTLADAYLAGAQIESATGAAADLICKLQEACEYTSEDDCPEGTYGVLSAQSKRP